MIILPRQNREGAQDVVPRKSELIDKVLAFVIPEYEKYETQFLRISP